MAIKDLYQVSISIGLRSDGNNQKASILFATRQYERKASVWGIGCFYHIVLMHIATLAAEAQDSIQILILKYLI